MRGEAELPHLTAISQAWAEFDPSSLLSRAAEAIGVSSATDQGWVPQPPPGIRPIGMTVGIPDPETLPVADLLAALQAVAEESPAEALRYGGSLGFEGLRRCLADKSQTEDGLEQGPDNFLITNGSAAAIDAVFRTFLSPADIVLVESPSFSGSLRTARGNLGRLEGVAVDSGGIRIDHLERTLSALAAQGTPAKILYTVPDFHNPTGTTLSVERRLQLLELTSAHRVLVLEDDAYCDLYFEERPLPSLYALAGGQGVLRAGTFSKTIATGLRVGWLQGRADFVRLCNQMRFDMGGSPLIHRALAKYAESGRWGEHIDEMRQLYAAKCGAMSEALRDECESFVRFGEPAGGFFLWLECGEGFSARAVVDAAAEEGLVCVPGHHFYLDAADDDRHIRIAFSTAPLTDMAEAARRLRTAFERVAG